MPAGRTLKRTLSLCGGEAVAEALHNTLARGVLHVVEDEEGLLTLQAPDVISQEERGGSSSSPPRPSSGSGKMPWPTVMGDAAACHAPLSLYPVLTGVGEHGPRAALLEAVVDAGPTRRLEKVGAINWHPECPDLVALKVSNASRRCGMGCAG